MSESHYKNVHENPQGPGDARPTAIQIVKDEGLQGKLQDKVTVVTGTSSGIGIETARALSLTGARLFLTARNIQKASSALKDVLEPGRVELIEMDNTNLDSVRRGASDILVKSNGQINILINNAGIMAVPDLKHTSEGHEMQFGVNYLAHFLLFDLLKPALLASASGSMNSRVVNLSSSSHNAQGINDSDNYDFQKGDYSALGAYGQSKTASIYMSNSIERRYGAQGLHATSVHPGLVATGLAQYLDPNVVAGMFASPEVMSILKSPEQGAATSVWAAVGKAMEDKGGLYLADCGTTVPAVDAGPFYMGNGYAAWAFDPIKEDRLWEDSLRMVGLKE